jgi:uncharacterized membrane protein (DUF485 family)
MTKRHNTESSIINYLFWIIYILLLLVLLPHTAWMFSKAEPDTEIGRYIAWAAATVFEFVIAVMTHKLSRHIMDMPKYTNTWKRIKARYFNAYGAGLLLAWLVSTYANLAHAIEFGQPIRIFTDWGLPVWTYSVAFGAILPTASLLFAWVLSSVIEQDATEGQPNPELDKANMTIRELRDRIRSTEQARLEAEQRADEAELRFGAASDIFAQLMSSELRERVLFARQQWPELPQSAIAVIAKASPARVSEIINEVR